MGTSLKRLKTQIVAELGGGPVGSASVEVELNDEQFNVAVQLAKQWFTAKKGFVCWRPINVTPGVSEYKLNEDVANVLDVAFQVPSDVAAFFSLGFFDIIPYGPQQIGAIGSGIANYSGMAQLLQFTEQRKRIFSVEPDWSFEPQTRKLYLTFRSGGTGSLALMKVKLADFDPEKLSDKDDYIFTRWVRSKCKEIVGRVRSKYDSLPGAGGPVSLDGKELLAEAKEELEKLEAEIFASQGPDGFMVG